MDDVLTTTGGYIPVRINSGGYIYDGYGNMVHKESRGLHRNLGTCKTLAHAKLQYPVENDVFILELTLDGGGAAVWVSNDQVEPIGNLLKIFSGCYGRWPIRVIRNDNGH